MFTNLEKIELDKEEYSYRSFIGITGKKFPRYCSNNPHIENNIGNILKKIKINIEKILKEENKSNFYVYIISSEKPTKRLRNNKSTKLRYNLIQIKYNNKNFIDYL